MMNIPLSKVIIFLAIGLLLVPLGLASAQESTDPFERYGQYTEDSDMAINHNVWDSMLVSTVVVKKPSSATMASTKPKRKTGSRISRGSNSAAREESNRVLYHLLEDEHLEMIAKYRRELEILPNYYPLSDFSKDEQLAYWLNLHNALVYEHMAREYPISKVKKLRLGKSSQKSLWDEKLVVVEGLPLSLNDIQNKILIRHWQTPMVLYGLYQGAIGGPSLPNRAFTGANVHTFLERSAQEFINSNRGIKLWGTRARISMIYDFGKSAFPNWKSDLKTHLAKYANAPLRSELAGAERFTADLFDWQIADTKDGTLSAGPAQNTAANLLTAGRGGISRGGAVSQFGEIERINKSEENAQSEGNVTSQECGTEDCPEDEADEDG